MYVTHLYSDWGMHDEKYVTTIHKFSAIIAYAVCYDSAKHYLQIFSFNVVTNVKFSGATSKLIVTIFLVIKVIKVIDHNSYKPINNEYR